MSNFSLRWRLCRRDFLVALTATRANHGWAHGKSIISRCCCPDGVSLLCGSHTTERGRKRIFLPGSTILQRYPVRLGDRPIFLPLSYPWLVRSLTCLAFIFGAYADHTITRSWRATMVAEHPWSSVRNSVRRSSTRFRGLQMREAIEWPPRIEWMNCVFIIFSRVRNL